jgi:hypothetical protein
MYVVTLCAILMYRQPDNAVIPLLLMNGKFASSLLSLMFFLFDARLLIYIVNGLVDGCIAIMVFIMYRSVRRIVS